MKPSEVRHKVLVVDDSLIIVQRVVEILKELDCIDFVSKASNYTEAIALLELNEYDVVLLDINLPGKNGIELLSYIKEKYPALKTMMLTNQSNDHYRSLCDKLGADFFVDKTSEFEKISQIMNTFTEETRTY